MQEPDEREGLVLGLFSEALAREDMDVRSRLEWLEEAAGRDGEILRRVVRLIEADSEAAAHAGEEASPDRVPEVFGSYVLDSLVAMEPGSTLWRGQRREGQFVRPILIRMVRPGRDRQGRVTLIAAALPALVQMDHPGIARILDGGTAPGGFGFIASEDVAGTPLTGFEGTAEQAVALIAEVCEALVHAHAHGIAHGGLTAEAICVTAGQSAVLTDFSGSLLGNAGQRASTAGDVRALAGILGQMLAGRAPPAQNPDDLAAIIAKATSEQADVRYRDAETFGDDLRRWQACRPVSAVRGTPGYKLRRALQQRAVRLGVAVAGVTAALLALGLLMRG